MQRRTDIVVAAVAVVLLAACGGPGGSDEAGGVRISADHDSRDDSDSDGRPSEDPMGDGDADPDDDAPTDEDPPNDDDPSQSLPSVNCQAFVATGTATSTNGATWTYASTDDGVQFELSGVLLVPEGVGPFPAVVVSHGYGGSATGYGRQAGARFRDFGAVVIATHYTHAQSPSGLPMGGVGASPENLQRATKALSLLACLPYVDRARVAAHGHSQGAFVTGQLVGSWPSHLRVASHTAGGVSETGYVDNGSGDVPTTSEAAARAIVAPYQLHHGDADVIVELPVGQNMASILGQVGTQHELHVYEGATHSEVALDDTVFQRIHDWYQQWGFFGQ